MTRRTVATTVLVVWGAALAWLGIRQMSPAGPTLLGDDVRTLSPTAAYYTITADGRHMGFASFTMDTVPGGLVVDERLMLDVPEGPSLRRATARTQANLSNALQLRDFVSSVNGPGGAYVVRGSMAGDSVVELALEAGDTRQTITFPVRAPFVLTSYLPLYLASNARLAPGDTARVFALDPLRLQGLDVAVRVLAESTLTVPDSAVFDSSANRWVEARRDTVRAWYLEQDAGGTTARVWIDALGRVAHLAPAAGMPLDRSAFEIAFYNLTLRDTAAVLSAFDGGGIAWRGPGPGGATDPPRDSLRVLVRGVDAERPALGGGRQEVRGDTVIVRREGESALQPSFGLPADSGSMGPYLVQDPLVQSDDPFVQAQARQVVGRNRNPRTAARLLAEWVDREIGDTDAAGPPSAPAILERRAGDANAHTLLYVAMARAVGLPARPVTGLLYAQGRFYFHAWAEVHLGRAWVAVDPMLGQFPADAAHLRLGVGGLAREVDLPHYLGSVTFAAVAPGD